MISVFQFHGILTSADLNVTYLKKIKRLYSQDSGQGPSTGEQARYAINERNCGSLRRHKQ